MTTTPEPESLSRAHSAKRARHRAIIDSALTLAQKNGHDGFSVDQLAERAGVSRRTVFNYFGSVNEVLLAAHGQVMDVLIADFQQRSAATLIGDGSIVAVFDEMAHLLCEIELVGPMSTLAQLLGQEPDLDPHSAQLVQEIVRRTAEQLANEAKRRSPQADQLDIDLLVHSLFDGLVVINAHWMVRTSAADTAESRAVWMELLNQLISTVRNGYSAPPEGAQPTRS